VSSSSSADPPTEEGERRDVRPGTIVSALIQAGLLSAEERERAEAVIDQLLSAKRPKGSRAPTRGRLLEVAGYVGGALVASAVVLFAAMSWADLGLASRLLLLAASAVVLGVASALLIVDAGGRAALFAPRHLSRRVLTGVLFTLADGALAGLAGVAGDARVDRGAVVAVITGLVLVLAAGCTYRLTAGVVSQVAAMVGVLVAAVGAVELLSVPSSRSVPLVIACVGLLWLGLAESPWIREVVTGRVLGCTALLVGIQSLIGDRPNWPAFLLLTLVGLAALARYLLRLGWPFLATGVLGLTLGITEWVFDLTGGQLGVAGALLVGGVILLGTAVAGLRLRRGRADPPPTDQASAGE
jgi:hypothetical protein